jgi:hypothetical protein
LYELLENEIYQNKINFKFKWSADADIDWDLVGKPVVFAGILPV